MIHCDTNSAPPSAFWPAVRISLALHLAAAIWLGFLNSSADPAPARPVFTTLDIDLADAQVAAAGGSAADVPARRAERPPEPPEMPRPRAVPENILLAPEHELTPRLARQEDAPEPRETRAADKRMIIPDAAAGVAQMESLASAGVAGAGDGAEGGFGAVDVQAAARAVIRPVYPVGARRRGEEGRVVLEVTVLENGRTSDARIVSSSNFAEIDRAAENAINRARFAPASRNGRAVASRVRLTFIFHLRD